jgi:FlaA1/EpsC-like NDP-sugar epimerase
MVQKMKIFRGKNIVIMGGTGSLGKILTRRILSGREGKPKKVVIFSRDETKQHYMRLEYQKRQTTTDEVIYNNFKKILEFRIGDVRDYHSVISVLKGADIVINAAALKQVPSCEYFPDESVKTNIFGAINIVNAIKEYDLPVETVVGISTDKACKPINVMGMTKALQERVFVGANILIPKTRFVCVRYGNVLASRGSVVPLFVDQILSGGPVTITTNDMTRFLLSLNDAVDIVIEVIKTGKRGDTYIPKAKSARMVDLAKVLIGNRKINIIYTGIRPGEKKNEILIAEDELWRTVKREKYYAIQSLLPEVHASVNRKPILAEEYSSAMSIMSVNEIEKLLKKNKLMVENYIKEKEEILK